MLKEEIKQIIDNLPDDCSLEDIQYTLYVRSKIQKGLEDIKAGNTFTNEEMERRFNKWFKQ
jgi:predicted transcriptional regulator